LEGRGAPWPAVHSPWVCPYQQRKEQWPLLSFWQNEDSVGMVGMKY